MAEDNRDPFDFGEDPLADADQLDVPDIGAEYTRSFEPPTAAPGVPPVSPPAAAPPSQFPPPATPPSQFPPPAASAPPPSQFPPPAANPPHTAPPESPGSFTPDPTAEQFPAVGATPPSAPTGYGDQPHTTPAYLSDQPGQDPGFGATPPPGAQPPNYGAPGQGIPPQQGAPSYAAPAYGVGGPGQPPQKKRRGCLFWGLLLTGLAALLIGGCSALLFFTGRGATDTANDFLTAAEAGDYPAAAALTNPDCGLTEAQIESDLAGASEHFIVGVGPIASGTVRINGIDAAITIEFRDDLVCTYTIESVN